MMLPHSSHTTLTFALCTGKRKEKSQLLICKVGKREPEVTIGFLPFMFFVEISHVIVDSAPCHSLALCFA